MKPLMDPGHRNQEKSRKTENFYVKIQNLPGNVFF